MLPKKVYCPGPYEAFLCCGLSRNIGRRRKNLKLNNLKRTKIVKKNQWNLDQKIIDSKAHIWSLSFNFRFSSRKVQSQQKIPRKITHFTIQLHSKHPTHFTNLNALKLAKIILSQHSQKLYSLCSFSSKHVSDWCHINHLHCTVSRRPRTVFSEHLESKCLYIHFNWNF